MPWEVEFHPECEAWANGLDAHDQEALLAAIRVLRRVGPQLGRPLVDSIRHSRHSNMKELRPPSSGTTEVRVLFAFDSLRQAILLVGGDKSGRWTSWYRENVPVAEARYDAHLAAIEAAMRGQRSSRKRGKRS